MVEARPLDTDVEDRLRGGVVEIDRHPAHQGQGRVDNCRPGGGRQQHSNSLFSRPKRSLKHQPGSQDSDQQLPARQPGSKRIGHFQPTSSRP